MSIALMDGGLMPLGAVLIGAVAEWAGALPPVKFEAQYFLRAGSWL